MATPPAAIESSAAPKPATPCGRSGPRLLLTAALALFTSTEVHAADRGVHLVQANDDEPDYATHSYFARHGYVGVRVDIRGFGNSGERWRS